MNSRWYILTTTIAVLITSILVFGEDGISIFLLAVAFACLFIRKSAIIQAAFLLITFSIAIGLIYSSLMQPSERARRMQCTNQLKQIGLALQNYQTAYKCFPPAYIADKNGKPMHSWRVLILPYLERHDLYNMYRFNEPWNGPNNSKLLPKRDRVYQCPSDVNTEKSESTSTNYVALVGKNTAWPLENSTSLADMRSRGIAKTILVIEARDPNIPWISPIDFLVDHCSTGNASLLSNIQHAHLRNNGYFYHPTPLGANAVCADGTVRSLPANMLKSDKLEKLFAIGGYDENMAGDTLLAEDLQVNWYNCIALALWVLSVLALLYWAVQTR